MSLSTRKQLKELGSKLKRPPSSTDALVKLLEQAATSLSKLEQSPTKSTLESLEPLFDAIVMPGLVKHHDGEVKLLVASCACEITRITAPEAPYSDDELKDIFQLIVSTFSGLSEIGSPSFGRRVGILETLARYRSCVVMLDLDCEDLINKMFSTFLSVASEDHPENVIASMQTIMVVLLEESEDIQEELLIVLLSVLGQDRSDISLAARKLAMNVIKQCAAKLETCIELFLVSLISGEKRSLSGQIDYHKTMCEIYHDAPQILSGIVPHLRRELQTDELDLRVKAVRLVRDLLVLPGSVIHESFQPLFLEFLKRLTDRVVEVRMSVLESVKTCILANPSSSEAGQMISALCDRLSDHDENVRKQMVAVICDVTCCSLTSVPVETVKLTAERLGDKSLIVKRYALERLVEIYRLFCSGNKESSKTGDYDWIPGKIMTCFYDEDFRSDIVERVFCVNLFPTDFSAKETVRSWIRFYSGFDKVEVKALEKMLEQKQRLQLEMQKYLSIREMHQEKDAPDFQKKVLACFRVMSSCFTDPAKAEENFQNFDRVEDPNIWKAFTTLLGSNTSSLQAGSCRDGLLKILDEKHPLYDFLSVLSLKCSYLLFNKEHVKEMLLEANIQKTAGETQLTVACMDILVILASFSPLLLGGTEDDLVNLLNDDNEVIREGVLHILAKAGGTIRDQLGVSSSSLDLKLERICLEGSRRQAKYAVLALASITKDDGLKSLSVLYKRLVDMLEEKTHLPAVLQSLGCIAQTAVSVFETRESEIEEFIRRNILESSHKSQPPVKECWEERSELCSLKIFGVKTLVKSYLPVKDAHLRLGVDGLLEILKSILLFGEISKDIESSAVDKAHLRLAAAKAVLRLSKHWDSKITVDLFYLTLSTSEITFPQAKKLFLNKVNQYIKEQRLDPKYACALLYDISGPSQLDSEQEKHNLNDIIQTLCQRKPHQFSSQSDGNSMVVNPENILPYLVHSLAHHSSFPSGDEGKDVKAFEPVYRKLYLFLSSLIHGDEVGNIESNINSTKDKESLARVLSIFRSIKCSDDIVDPAKTKNSHMICDLGLSVTKILARNDEDLRGLVSLPTALYKLREKKESEESLLSEAHTWLADENVFAHFASLKLEINPEADKVNDMNDSETDRNEVPLGKMIESLKARGNKSKKAVKSKPLPAETKNGDDVDVLKMVREINLDGLGSSIQFESSNGHGSIPKKVRSDQKQKEKRRNTVASETTDVPIPKRQRSSPQSAAYKSSIARNTIKGSKLSSMDNLPLEEEIPVESSKEDEGFDADSEMKTSSQRHVREPTESVLLASTPKHSNLSRNKRKDTPKYHSDKAKKADEYDTKKSNNIVEAESKKSNSDSKSSMASAKKRKRKSIAGLAKCTSKKVEKEIMDLIDSRIKVWWPLDKAFYEGTIQSYDPEKDKHVILYDDGDIEVLCLEKERWELLDNSGKPPAKRPRLSKTPQKELQSNQKENILSSSPVSKKTIKKSSPSKVQAKRTPRKNLKQGQKGAPKSSAGSFGKAGSTESPSMSDPEPAEMSKSSDLDSEDSEGEQLEISGKSSKGNERDKSPLDKRNGEETENSPKDRNESGQEDSISEGSRIKHRADTRGSSEEVGSPSDVKQPDLSREGSGTEADDSEGSLSSSERSDKKTPTTDKLEFSDDELLSEWKSRVGKPVKGK